MLSPEKILAISRMFANKETLDTITRNSYEAYRAVLILAGVNEAALPPWERVGMLTQAAWAMAVATSGEAFIKMCTDVSSTVQAAKVAEVIGTAEGDESDGSG